ncbi:N-acetylneuraminate synthase [Mucilaginibacter ginkgonis]|uniref:N-acetylneuraminate synthase n=1 Tax=Mucilaginibacter ginkgonis TaxID=2682091 RepID=A0A6I4I1Z3_9SPHI|nr:N-acetylneuraminate synthase [Mucilaginibacter ginkgonis]QQL50834.1 N-acetylneuraminate synthase [Mucilaginibacter ginkgonis]
MKTNRSYIIAEAGVNHNGDVNIALQLIDEASKAGADCVKFQTFKASQIVSKNSPKAKYQLLVTDPKESQAEMLKKLELDLDAYKILIERCKEKDIDFLSTPYNKQDADFLEDLNVTGYKIASGQLTEIPFLKYVAAKQKTMIISTGMANMADVFSAVEAIRETGNDDIIVLQCTTNYPSKIEDANILAMDSIKVACKVRVGYSDHVENNFACYAAVALGAEIVEKHFTLDKNMEGPDHSSSLNPEEFKELIYCIRQVEQSLGTGLKVPSVIERDNIYGMKRSLVALSDLAAGTVLEEKHIGYKRPANGLSPNMVDDILGKQLLTDVKEDEALQYSAIKW